MLLRTLIKIGEGQDQGQVHNAFSFNKEELPDLFDSAHKDFFVNINTQKFRELTLKYEFLSFPQTLEYLPNLVLNSNVAMIHGCWVAAATFRRAMHFAMLPTTRGLLHSITFPIWH